jgi:hypothetical protein
MAAIRCNKRYIGMGSWKCWGYFRRPEHLDFSKDGLHLNRDGAKHLENLYGKVRGTGAEGQRKLEI